MTDRALWLADGTRGHVCYCVRTNPQRIDKVTNPKHQAASMDGLRVLIVEDETLVALLLEDMLADIGCTVIGSASTVNGALETLRQTAPGAVVLDINLGGEQSFPVADVLSSRGVPFMFATGYGERAPIPEELASAPVVQKPYTLEVVENALGKLQGTVAQ